jgi:hypothetical protein
MSADSVLTVSPALARPVGGGFGDVDGRDGAEQGQ